MEAWYRHLDVCKQCIDHPFDLCAIGSSLLEAAAIEKPIGPALEALREEFGYDVDGIDADAFVRELRGED